jgi:hypothetical protein
MKHRMGLDRTQTLLFPERLAYNLKRVLNLVSFAKLMAAVG